MKPLVVIPARGGSRRLPGKNIRLLNGKPLIHYTIEAAREVFDDSVICVSTDSEEIKKVSEQTGLKVPFLRPEELATDTADSRSVVLHAYEYYKQIFDYKADFIVLLQPTSPFRKAIHIKEALELYHDNLDMVVSVKETKANPYYVLYEENDEGYLEKSKKVEFAKHQDTPNVWELNGAIYLIKVDSLIKTQPMEFNKVIKYTMDSYTSIDIDTEFDWLFAKYLVSEVDSK